MIVGEKKLKVIKDLQAHKTDTGSASVQVGILTAQIKELTAHLQLRKKDFAARRGLLQKVGQRRRLLKYIAAHNSQGYIELIKKLGIRR